MRAATLILAAAAIGVGAGLAWRQRDIDALSQAADAAARGRRNTIAAEDELAAVRRRLESLTADAIATEAANEETRTVLRELEKGATARQAARRSGPTALAPAAAPPEAAVPAFAAGSSVRASEWRNVGAATPEAALQTALFAAAGGDVDALASRIVFDQQSADAAAALLASLPPETRASYRSPEHLIAALTIPDAPTARVDIHDWGDVNTAGSTKYVTANLVSDDGKIRTRSLLLRRTDAGWGLFATEKVVARYARQLKGGADRPSS